MKPIGRFTRLSISAIPVFAGFLGLAMTTVCVADDLLWAKGAGSVWLDAGRGVSVDAAGHSLVTGYFNGAVTFGAGEPNQTTLEGSGYDDVFVAKYASDGTLAWVKQAGGTNYDGGSGITVDSAGYGVMTGHFSGPATFGAGEVNETVLEGIGGEDIFIAKYAPDGSLSWAKQAGGTATSESGNAIAVDTAGNSVVTGAFYGTAVFGAGESNETSLLSAGCADIFIARYAPDGSLMWARQAGGASCGEQGNGIAVDADGNSVVTGEFWGAATFGSNEPNETTLESVGGADIFVVKYAPDGSLLWAKQAGGSEPYLSDAGRGVSAGPGDDFVVTGNFAGVALFGANEPNETMLTSAGSEDIFVAKYDPQGYLLWATQAGGPDGFWPGNDAGYGIAVDGVGTSVVTGHFFDLATFGVGEPNETTLEGGGMFLAKYAPDGAFLWVTQAGGTGYAVAVDASGNSSVTGEFQGLATFGAGELNETILESAGASDIFVAKWGQVEDQGDVFLTELRVPSRLVLRKAHEVTRNIAVFGDGDTIAQDATVALSAQGAAGLVIEVTPELVTKGVEPGDPLTRFGFEVQIECKQRGCFEVHWMATIDAAQNADTSNDTAQAISLVQCGKGEGKERRHHEQNDED